MNPTSSQPVDPQSKEQRGDIDIYAILMDFRQVCLDQRSKLHETGDVDSTTDKIITAQDQATEALTALLNKSRIDELELLQHTKWADLAYDIPGYLKDRIKQLQEEARNNG